MSIMDQITQLLNPDQNLGNSSVFTGIGAGGAGSTPIAGVGSTSFLNGATQGPVMGALSQTGNNGGTQNGNNMMNMLFGNHETGQQGALAPTAQALTGLASSFMGMKQYGLAKDAFKESKRQFNLNFDAQKKDYNNQLADRQRARLNSSGYGGSRYRSVSEVLEKDGI